MKLFSEAHMRAWVQSAHPYKPVVVPKDIRQDMINHIKVYDCLGSSQSRWAVVMTGHPMIEDVYFRATTGCYGPLDMCVKFKLLAGSAYVPKNNEGRMKFFNWIMSRETSPWRKYLDDDIEIIEDSQFIRGFILGPKTIAKFTVNEVSQFGTHLALLNFLICVRMVNTFPGHIDMWAKAVELGAEPEVAFYLCRNFWYNKNSKKIFAQSIKEIGSFAFSGKIDLKRLKEGNPRENTKYRGGLWAVDDNFELSIIDEVVRPSDIEHHQKYEDQSISDELFKEKFLSQWQ